MSKRVSLEELEFFAEDDLIEIMPNVSMNTLYLMEGEYGPFEPLERVIVPLWLAIVLKKNRKCRIVAPEWLDVEKLNVVLDHDRNVKFSKGDSLYPLPPHYIEIYRIFLENCKDDIADVDGLRSVMDSIIKVRENRLCEFKAIVIENITASLEERFNRGETHDLIKRPNYDIVKGASEVELHRLLCRFIPQLEEINKYEDIRSHIIE